MLINNCVTSVLPCKPLGRGVIANIHVTKMQLLCFVSGNVVLKSLSKKAAVRTQAAFRPKTRQAYFRMFKVFLAFCICMDVSVARVNVEVILSFLECLVHNKCSVAMISNYVSAIKACLVLYDLPFHILDHQKIKYFQKSLRINRPLSLTSHNIIDLDGLEKISLACQEFNCGQVLRAVFLTGFFGFFRLSNLAPHSVSGFDPSRHLTGQDLFFTKKMVKVLIKWSKTIQTRDTAQVISLPKLKNRIICPFRALKALQVLYPMSADHSAFQVNVQSGWQPITDSKIRKCLKSINMTLGLNPHFYTFHSFRRSGATFAYNAHIPIQQIQRHGTWSSDCIWRYIQADHSSGESLALSLATVINA